MWLASEEKSLQCATFTDTHKHCSSPFTFLSTKCIKMKGRGGSQKAGNFFFSMLSQKLLKLQYNKCWKTERLKGYQFGRSTKNCGRRSNLFHSSLAIKINLCSTAAKVSQDEAFIPQLFTSMKIEENLRV